MPTLIHAEPTTVDALKSTFASHRAGRLLLVAATLWTVWFAIGSPRLWDRDEPRNARCAVEMLQRNDWVVPMFNDELRTHKPILLYWLQMSSYAIFGVSEFAARFGSALCGTLVCFAVYMFAKRHISNEYAWWSALAMSSCFMFVVASRAATPDAVLLATSSIGIFCIASSQLDRSTASKRNYLWLTGFVCLGLAVLAKGPVGVVIPLAVLGTWTFIQNWSLSSSNLNGLRIEHVPLWRTVSQVVRNPKSWWRWLTSLTQHTFTIAWTSFRELRLGIGLAIVACISIPWYAWVGARTDGDWLYGFFIEHNVQRAVSSMEGHSGGLWFYPAAILLGVFPWSLLVIPIGVWSARNMRNDQRSPLVQLGIIWIAITITAFSCASTKLPSYITTCYPGAALLIGGTLLDLHSSRYKLGRKLSSLAGYAVGIVALALGIGIIAASVYLSMPLLTICLLGPVLLLWPSLAFLRLYNAGGFDANRQAMSLHRFAFAGVALTGMVLGIGPAVVSLYRNDIPQIMSIAKTQTTSASWMSVGTLEPSWVFYLGQPIREVVRTDEDPFFEKGWARTAIEHLLVEEGRLFASSDDAALIEQHWEKSDSEQTKGLRLERLTEFYRLFDNDKSVVLRAVPAAKNSQLAEVPQKSSETAPNLQLQR